MGLITIRTHDPEPQVVEPYDQQLEDDEIFAGNYRPHDIFDDSLPLINFRVETN